MFQVLELQTAAGQILGQRKKTKSPPKIEYKQAIMNKAL